MGSKRQPTPPPAPNPYDIISAEAQANRINQNTPYGSLQFSGPNNNTATLSLDPRIQQLLDSQISSDQSTLNQALQRQGQLPQGDPFAGFGIPGSTGVSQQIPGLALLGNSRLPTPPTLQAPNASALQAPGLIESAPFLGLARSPNLTTSVPGANLQTSVQGLGNLQSNIPGVNLQSGVNLQGNVDLQRNIPGVQLQRQIDLASSVNQPDIQKAISGLDLSGVSALPQNAEMFRGDVSRALFDRSSGFLNEQFNKDEDRLRQTLANQGLQSGGQGFGSEFGTFNQRKGETFENLARDAVIFGGQEASRSLADQLSLRGQGVNEALSRFGAGLTQGQFANQASQQQFNNQLAGLDFGNQALLQEAGFGNNAALNQFGVDQQRGQFSNDAALNAGNFANTAALNAGNFANNAALSQFGINQAQAGFANQAAMDRFNAELSRAGFGNQSQLQQLGANLQGAEFGNNAALAGANFNQNAALSELDANLQSSQFANQARQQGFANQQSIRDSQIQNALLQQNTQSQNFGLQQQALQNQLAQIAQNNAGRTQLFNETAASRGTQFNELAALLGLQQVSQPQLQNFFNPGQINTTDAFGLQQQALQNVFNTQSGNAASKKGGTADLAGLLGTAAIGAASASDRRLKDQVVKVGKYRDNNVYLFRWNKKAKPLGLEGYSMGVMADEVDPKFVTVRNGYLAVDYGALQCQ